MACQHFSIFKSYVVSVNPEQYFSLFIYILYNWIDIKIRMILESITRTLQVILVYVRENPTVIPMLLFWIVRNAYEFILDVQRSDMANPASIPFVVLCCIRISHVILLESGNRRDNPTTMGIIRLWIKETLPIFNVLVYGRGNRDVRTDILMFLIWINRTTEVLVLCAGRINVLLSRH